MPHTIHGELRIKWEITSLNFDKQQVWGRL